MSRDGTDSVLVGHNGCRGHCRAAIGGRRDSLDRRAECPAWCRLLIANPQRQQGKELPLLTLRVGSTSCRLVEWTGGEQLSIKHLADLAGQRVGGERFLQERYLRLQQAVTHHRVVGVAGYVEYL